MLTRRLNNNFSLLPRMTGLSSFSFYSVSVAPSLFASAQLASSSSSSNKKKKPSSSSKKVSNNNGKNSKNSGVSSSSSSSSKALQKYQGADETMMMEEEEEEEQDQLPDLLLVQLCDHMQHDQGVKRHAITITFGHDGFQLTDMCRIVRKDLKTQLASSYWQMHQTQERSAFFVCTRISHGTADLLITSMTQRVISHVEDNFGYRLNSSYVTLSPDVQHTSVRMLYHYFIFRRQKEETRQNNNNNLLVADRKKSNKNKKKQKSLLDQQKSLEEQNGIVNFQQEAESGKQEEGEEEDDDDEEYEKGQPIYRNFEPPRVGPQAPSPPRTTTPKIERVKKIWDDDDEKDK